jgi:putative SOS response-associated peptidase YedK
MVPIVREVENGKRSIALVRWGLIPVWAKDTAARFPSAEAMRKELERIGKFCGVGVLGKRRVTVHILP